MSTNRDTRRGLDLAFGTSFLTTMAVAVAPSFVAFGFLVWSTPNPRPVLASFIALFATAAAFIGGSKVWANQPEAHGFSFADLMLWHWIRREWAEEKLVRNARLLGYDRQGRFVGKVEVSPEKQLFAARQIGSALDAKSSYTLNHSKRVEKHVRDVAAQLELSSAETEQLATAAALHDIGNIRIPEHVIRKAGELTIEERSTIEGHVLLGALMAFEAGGEAVVQGLRHHHERWDGRGYPNGLKGEEIPLFARIIGIAEAYDAMTSTRPYRQSLTQDQAVAVLREEGGTQFDPRVVETFAATLPEPLQIVERFPALAWAQRQVRELSILFRRVGGTAVSAAASTIAIALILGTALLKPDVFPGGGKDGSAGSRPERRMIAQGNSQSGDAGERIALAGAESVAEGVVVAEEFAESSSAATVDEARVLGERITIEGFEPAGDGHSGGGTDHGNQGGNGGNGSGGGNSDTVDPDTEEPGSENPGSSPDVVEGGGGGSTNPDPVIDVVKPGNGKGNAHGYGNGNGYGKPEKDRGKPDGVGNGQDKGKPDGAGNGKGKPDGWVNPGNGGSGKPEKTETGPPADKGKPDDNTNNGGGNDSSSDPGPEGSNGNGADKTDDGWAESGNDDKGKPDGSGDAGASDGSSDSDAGPGNSSGDNGNSDAQDNGPSKDTGSDDSSGSSGDASDSSPGNSGNAPGRDNDRGKPTDEGV